MIVTALAVLLLLLLFVKRKIMFLETILRAHIRTHKKGTRNNNTNNKYYYYNYCYF